VRLIAGRSEDSMSGRAAAMRDGGTYAKFLLDEMERSQFLEQLAHSVGIDPGIAGVTRGAPRRRSTAGIVKKSRRIGKNELDIVALLIKYPTLLRRVQDLDSTLEDLFHEVIVRLIQRLLDQYEETGRILTAMIGDGEDEGDLREILTIAEYEVADEKAESALDKKLEKLRKDRLKKKREELLCRHREAEQQGDAEVLAQLGKELDEVLRLLRVGQQRMN